jgi:hypothetical protein
MWRIHESVEASVRLSGVQRAPTGQLLTKGLVTQLSAPTVRPARRLWRRPRSCWIWARRGSWISAYGHGLRGGIGRGALPAHQHVDRRQPAAAVNAVQRGTVDVRYYVSRHISLGGAHWFDQYRVNDFALGAQTLTTLAKLSFPMLGNVSRPYTANTLMGRLTYIW